MTPSHLESQDVIGDVYEFLIERFASDAGKFYTLSAISTLLAKLMTLQPGSRISDLTCGSGSLLIKVSIKSNSIMPNSIMAHTTTSTISSCIICCA
ncbi:N-6 DNA methylase [Spirosoma linguale]|uniref:N-6 DNA methylase n=1 Tax=Spirosoma linguale TaxID=108 RepID=UPI003CC7E7E4